MNQAAKKIRLEMQGECSGEPRALSSTSPSTLSGISSTSSRSINNYRRNTRELPKKNGIRESARLMNNNNKEIINHEPRQSTSLPIRVLNEDPILVLDSDEENDDDVQVFKNKIHQFS